MAELKVGDISDLRGVMWTPLLGKGFSCEQPLFLPPKSFLGELEGVFFSKNTPSILCLAVVVWMNIMGDDCG